MTRDTEGKITGVSRKEITEAVLANDCGLIAEMLEGFDFVKDDTPPPISMSLSETSL